MYGIIGTFSYFSGIVCLWICTNRWTKIVFCSIFWAEIITSTFFLIGSSDRIAIFFVTSRTRNSWNNITNFRTCASSLPYSCIFLGARLISWCIRTRGTTPLWLGDNLIVHILLLIVFTTSNSFPRHLTIYILFLRTTTWFRLFSQ